MSRAQRRSAREQEGGLEVITPDVDLDFARLEAIAGGEPRQAEFTGTKALMLAVLEDGIRSYLSAAKNAAQEAEYWVHSAHRRSPFSFVVVCETLNLSPDAVRRVLLKLRSERVPPKKALPRSRPNVRMASRMCSSKRRRSL